jgi:hypothetical protein
MPARDAPARDMPGVRPRPWTQRTRARRLPPTKQFFGKDAQDEADDSSRRRRVCRFLGLLERIGILAAPPLRGEAVAPRSVLLKLRPAHAANLVGDLGVDPLLRRLQAAAVATRPNREHLGQDRERSLRL